MKHIVLGCIFVLYPLIVFLGLKWVEPSYIAIVLALLACIRFYHTKTSLNIPFIKVTGIVAILLLLLSVFSNSALLLKLYPVIMSLSFFTIFVYSLVRPPAVITLIASARDKLTVNAVAYTKKVTVVWSIFFFINAVVSLFTVFMSDDVWALYNGFISYLFMGVLFIGEWLVRRQFKKNDQSDYIT